MARGRPPKIKTITAQEPEQSIASQALEQELMNPTPDTAQNNEDFENDVLNPIENSPGDIFPTFGEDIPFSAEPQTESFTAAILDVGQKIMENSKPIITIPEFPVTEEKTTQPEEFGPKPPKVFRRNSYGLLDGVEYVFKPDGRVDWRKMIRPEHLVPNKQKTQETDITKLEDKDLIILLAGLKELAQLRGYYSVSYPIVTDSRSYCSASCCISWFPNYETENQPVYFESRADAHPENSNGFGIHFLATIAENRAFCRAVRNFLKINIVAQDELGATSNQEEKQESIPAANPYQLLQALLDKKKVKFEHLVIKLQQESKEGDKEAFGYKVITDIPKVKILSLIERLKKYNPAK